MHEAPYTVHQLTDSEFTSLLGDVKGTRKISLKGQLSLELLLLSRGWSFDQDYRYLNSSTKVKVICNNGHLCTITPSNIKSGKGCRKCRMEVVQKDFEKLVKERQWSYGKGYKYINVTSKVELECPAGHTQKVLPSAFNRGSGCARCAKNDKLHSKNEFETLVDDLGWFLEKEYVYYNNNTKVEITCPNGHINRVTPHHFKEKGGCAHCSKEVRRSRFENYVVNSGWDFAWNYKYVDTNTKVSLVCKKGHSKTSTPSYFETGKGCASCNFEDYKDRFESFVKEVGWNFGKDYQFLGSDERVPLVCDRGHLRNVRPANFLKGSRCSVCTGRDLSFVKTNFEQSVSKRGWKLGKNYNYVDTFTKVELICDNGHLHWIRPHNFKGGNGCPKCAKYGYSPDKPAYIYLQSLSVPEGGEIVAYKVGITNRCPFIRMGEQSRKSKVNHTMLDMVYLEDGEVIANIERSLKANITTSYLEKEICPDGYTETFPPSEVSYVMDILETLK